MRNISSLTGCLIFITLLVMSTPGAALGQDEGLLDGFERVETFRTEAGIRGFGSFTNLILTILQIITALLAAVAVAAIIYGGFLYITAGGNEGRAEEGKKVLLYAVIGLLIVGAAGIVVNLVINIFAA